MFSVKLSFNAICVLFKLFSRCKHFREYLTNANYAKICTAFVYLHRILIQAAHLIVRLHIVFIFPSRTNPSLTVKALDYNRGVTIINLF